MKTKILLAFVVLISIVLASSAPKKSTKSMGLTNEEIGKGLKEALSIGTDSAVKYLMKTDGFYKDMAIKILMPKEAAELMKYKNKVKGLAPIVDEMELRMNRAAEDAAKEAIPIFKSAIMNMSITDALAILKGGNNAATLYLKSQTESKLVAAFSPKVKTSLDKPLVPTLSANDGWKSSTQLWNKYAASPVGQVLKVKPINVDLTNYVTSLAVKAVFSKIELQEQKIRANKSYQVTDLLNKVFSLF